MHISKSIFFKVVKFIWKLRKKNHVSVFSDFYFSSYGHFCKKDYQFSMNFHDISKNKNRKNLKFHFLSIQPIPDLSCKYKKFWKKIYIYFNFEDIEQKINFNFFSVRFETKNLGFFFFYLFLTYKSKYYLLLISNINHWVAERLMRWAVGRWSGVRVKHLGKTPTQKTVIQWQGHQ